MPLKRALARTMASAQRRDYMSTLWRQHLMSNYGLRQTHRKIIGKTKKSTFCVPYSVPPAPQELMIQSCVML
jgi:hypothetical protein